MSTGDPSPSSTLDPPATHSQDDGQDGVPTALEPQQSEGVADGGRDGEEQHRAGDGRDQESNPANAADGGRQQRQEEGQGDDVEEDDDGLLFSCRCESARSVTTLLSCLRHVSCGSGSSSSGGAGGGGGDALSQARRSRADLSLSHIDHTVGGGGRGGPSRAQHATVFAGPSGLTFHVHGAAKQSQASVDMQAGLFSDYYVAEQVVPIIDDEEEDGQTPASQSKEPKTEVIQGGEFCINLTTVLECLHVLGTASLDRTKLCLSYDRHDAIFRIELLEDGIGASTSHDPAGGGGVLSTCAIPGLAVPDDEDDGASGLAVAFRSDPIVARAIVRSDYLRDAIVELSDVPGAVSATVGISPGGVELATVGHSSECHVSLPHAGNAAVFVSLECDPPKLHARSFPLHSVLSAMRGLEIGSETCVSLNSRGMVAIQHQVLDMVGNGQPNFVDFIMGCLEDDEEEEEEQEDDVELGGAVASQQSSRAGWDPSDDDRRVGARLGDAASAQRSDEEGGGRTSPLIRLGGSRSSGDDDDDENDENDDPATEGGSAVPLFGTVGDFGRSSRSHELASSKSGRSRRDAAARRRRARRREPPQSRSSDDEGSVGEAEGRGRKRRSPTSESVERRPSRQKRAEAQVDNGDSDEETTDNEGSLDVNAAVMSSPARGHAEENHDEAPSSPELMYGDTRLGYGEGSNRGTKGDRGSSASRQRTGLSTSTAGGSRHYSDDDTDDDFV